LANAEFLLMAISIPPEAKPFKMAILPGVIFIFVAGFVLGHGVGFCMHLVKHHSPVNWSFLSEMILYSIPALLIYAFLFALIIRMAFPTYLSSSGIYGHSFWGIRHYLGWTDIVRARKFRMGNLAYLRLYARNGRAMIWLPLFQSSRREFFNEIRKFAPPNHQILNHLG
jgi:hypothetical protein